MIDLAFLRANLDAVAERLAARGYTLDISQFRELDLKRRAAITESEQLKAQKNTASAEVGKLRQGGGDTSGLQQKIRSMDERIIALGEEVKALDEAFRGFLVTVPNVPHESVPTGKDETDNVEIKRWGEPPKFDFAPKA